jgi:hypothetical protein
MIKNKQERKAPSDFKEPYEFRLLIGDNIICQRYFKINNFNPLSLNSFELTQIIRTCANLINEDLKSKSRVYTWHMTPLVFNNEDEMKKWFSNPNNVKTVRFYETIVIKDDKTKEFAWDGEKIIECDKKVDDGTFSTTLTDKDTLTYEFAFYVKDKKIVSTIFDGVYPYFIRRNIDLSNSRGKFEGEDLSRLSFESYILNCLVYDRPDLIKKIVKDICYVCSMTDDKYYTTSLQYTNDKGKKVKYHIDFNNPKHLNSKYAKEIAKAKKYLHGDFSKHNK